MRVDSKGQAPRPSNHVMRIIAIETSGRYGSVAALLGEADGATPLREIALGGDQRTAQSFAPALKELLTQIDWSPQSVDLVAVAVGPGSFTGLRIGVTTAKAFAYATDAEVIGVDSLTVIAAQAPSSDSPLWTILDAQRQELFAAQFAAGVDGLPSANFETAIVTRDVWLGRLQPGERVSGPPLRTLQSQLPTGVNAVLEELWQPMASTIGQVGWRAYESGQRDDVWKLAPHYYRASAAEEKAARTNGI